MPELQERVREAVRQRLFETVSFPGDLHDRKIEERAGLIVVIDDPDTVAEVTAVFHVYECALLRNDVKTLDAMFLHSDRTVRYGVADVQYGIDEVRAFRAVQRPFDRTLSRTTITAFGRDVAIASTLFHRDDFPRQVGRQMQTWIRTPDGWRVAAAHVSMMDEPIAEPVRRSLTSAT